MNGPIEKLLECLVSENLLNRVAIAIWHYGELMRALGKPGKTED